jgi:hypothetical protein
MFPETWPSHPKITVSTATTCPVPCSKCASHCYTHTHVRTYIFLACYFLAVHGVPSSYCSVCSVTTQRHKQPQYQLLTSGCPEGRRSAVLWYRTDLTLQCAPYKLRCPVTSNSEFSNFALFDGFRPLRDLTEVCRRSAHSAISTLTAQPWWWRQQVTMKRHKYNELQQVTWRDLHWELHRSNPGSVIHCLKPYRALPQSHQCSASHTRRPISI